MKNLTSSSRRQFLRQYGLNMTLALPAAIAFNKIIFSSVQAEAKAAKAKVEIPPGLVMVKPTDPTAQALGYHEDAKKVDSKKFPKRAGAEGAKQFCKTCAFYQAKDPAKDPVAACQILQNQGVYATGWCNSWAQRT